MPLVYQQNINESTIIGVWHITEAESFFKNIPLQREITHWHKRLQHLAARHLLKTMVPDFPLSAIKIATTRKPFLENEAYHFSISHCRDYAAVLISKAFRTGVDIEMVNEKIENIIPKFLTSAELSIADPEEIKKTATLFWSVKESIYKWQGSGGTDFREDIHIENFTGDLDGGTVNCNFKNEISLQARYLFFRNYYLTWVFSHR